MNILHIVNVSFVLPYYLGEQINYFKSRGDNIFIVCSPSDQLSAFSEFYQIETFGIPISRNVSPLLDTYSIIKIIKIIYKYKIDVVIGHTPKGGFISMIASFIANVKNRIYFRHGLMFETSDGIAKNIYVLAEKLTGCLATTVVCVSKSVLDMSNVFRLNEFSKNIIINHGTCNGIDSQIKFNPELVSTSKTFDLKLKYNIEGSDFVFGYVGRIVGDKGIAELLDAWQFFSLKYRFAKLLLVGPLEERDSLNDKYKSIILNNPSIIHVGYVEDTSIFYKLMDVFILPSYREGFPTVVLEASSMGLPVITTRKTGCIDSIIENETGIFSDIDYDSLINSMETLINRSDLCKKLGSNGREFVVNSFSQIKIWENLYTLYHNL